MTDALLLDDLFQQILLKPAFNGANEIFIVSGYASFLMASHHIEKLNKKDIKINLIVGMTSRDGLSRTNHQGFKSLMTDSLNGRFNCSYVVNRPPIHSKVYSWTQSGKPLIGFTGSANYSQQAFISKKQGEIITQCNPDMAYEYYQSLISDSIFCTHQDADFVIDIYKEYQRNETELKEALEQSNQIDGLEKVQVSLLSKKAGYIVPPKSGLNWGYAAPRNKNDSKPRERNDAYIHLSPKVYKSDFFPRRGIHFSVTTDNGIVLICKRAQKTGEGHAIETPSRNSELGEYFRNRLGLSNGQLITKEHLINYGRTDVDFYKIDENSYYMDFSV